MTDSCAPPSCGGAIPPRHSMMSIRLPALLPACLLALASCIFDDSPDGGGPGVPSQVDFEIGEGFEGQVSGTSQVPDAARYSFRVDSGATGVFRWAETGARLRLIVVDSSGIEQVTTDGLDSSLDWNGVLRFPVVHSGTYELLVIGRGQTSFRIGSARTEGLPAWIRMPDAYEDDGSTTRATPLLLGGDWQMHTTTTGGRGDIDWFRFEVDSGWDYVVTCVDSQTFAHANDSTGLWADAATPIMLSTLAAALYQSDARGMVYYRVDGPPRGGHYRIQLRGGPRVSAYGIPVDAYEKDDSWETAKPIVADGPIQHRTLELQNPMPDWISLQVDSGRTYTVRIQDTTGTASLSHIYSQDKVQRRFRELSSVSFDSAGRTMRVRDYELVAPWSGRWMLEVGGWLSRYTIAVTSRAGIPDSSLAGPYEPDDAWRFARPIATDGTAQDRVLEGADVDHIAFQAEGGRTYRIVLRDTTAQTIPIVLRSSDSVRQVVLDSLKGVERVLTFPC